MGIPSFHCLRTLFYSFTHQRFVLFMLWILFCCFATVACNYILLDMCWFVVHSLNRQSNNNSFKFATCLLFAYNSIVMKNTVCKKRTRIKRTIRIYFTHPFSFVTGVFSFIQPEKSYSIVRYFACLVYIDICSVLIQKKFHSLNQNYSS